MAKKKKIKVRAEYDLPKPTRKHDYRILACDPGTSNFGVSCVGVRNEKIDVIANSLLTNPIQTLTAGFKAERTAYRDELMRWIELYDPDLIIAERFQMRGGSSAGTTIEVVATMNALLGVLTKKPIKYVIASQWKNAFNKRWAAGDKEFLKSLYKEIATTPHVLDASLIGVYGLEYAMQRQLKYTPSRMIEMVEVTSCLELKRKRK